MSVTLIIMGNAYLALNQHVGKLDCNKYKHLNLLKNVVSHFYCFDIFGQINAALLRRKKKDIFLKY